MPIQGTQVIQRVAALLRHLAANAKHGVRLVDLERATQLERGTTHRLLQGLIAEGLASQNQRSRRYFLGPAMYEIGIAAAPLLPLRDVCHPFIRSIAESTGDTAFLMVRSGFDSVCLDRREGEYPIKAFSVEVGRRRPFGVGSSSVAMMSCLTRDEVHRICVVNNDRIIAFFPRYTLAKLQARIEECRIRGYATGNVLEVPELSGVAVAICDAAGRPIAAIGVSAITSRLNKPREKEVAALLSDAVREIERGLLAE